MAPAAEMAPRVPTIKYEISAFEPPLPLDMYFEKSGILLLVLSPLKGLSYDEVASRSAGDELMARAVVAVGSRAEATADRARVRVTVERGAIGSVRSVRSNRREVLRGGEAEEERRGC